MASRRCGQQNSSTVDLVYYTYDGRARRGWMRKVQYTLVSYEKKLCGLNKKWLPWQRPSRRPQEAVDKLNAIRRVAAAMRPLVTISTVAICWLKSKFHWTDPTRPDPGLRQSPLGRRGSPTSPRSLSGRVGSGRVGVVERGTYGGIAGNGGEKPGVVAVELGAAGGREVRHRRDEVGEHEHLQDERNHGPDEREYHAAHRPDTSQVATNDRSRHNARSIGLNAYVLVVVVVIVNVVVISFIITPHRSTRHQCQMRATVTCVEWSVSVSICWCVLQN